MAPLFTKLLTTTDVQKRLAIPTDCLKHLPSYEGKCSVSLQVMDDTGNVWNFDCSTRKGNYPKPAFGRGWRHFVNSRGISVGDRVVFYRDVEAGVYRIEVQRKIMLFGQECWSNPPPADHRGVNSEKRTAAEAEVNEVQTRQNIRLHQPAAKEEVNSDKTTTAEAEAEGKENEEESKKNSSS